MIGTSQPWSTVRLTISGSAAAASSLFTVTRTSCDPARARAATWSAVDAASPVSVFVMDCTTMGYALPTATSRIQVVVVLRRGGGVTKGYAGGRMKEKFAVAREGASKRY